jgi:hypothetical protein
VPQATTESPALGARTILRPMRQSKRRSWQNLRSIQRSPNPRIAPHGRTKRVRSGSCAQGQASQPRKPPQMWESQSSHSRRGIVEKVDSACIALRDLNAFQLVPAGTRKSPASRVISTSKAGFCRDANSTVPSCHTPASKLLTTRPRDMDRRTIVDYVIPHLD